MAIFKITSICKVCNKTYVDAKDKEEAKKEFELGNGYGYEEIDSWDEEIDTIEKIED